MRFWCARVWQRSYYIFVKFTKTETSFVKNGRRRVVKMFQQI